MSRRLIEPEGWFLVATRGRHRQDKHLSKPGRVTAAGHLADEIAPGTLGGIAQQAGMDRSRMR